MEGVMKKRIFTVLILFVFASPVFAGDVYTYTDKDGITVISNEPIPEKYEKKAKKIESNKLSSPAELQTYEQQQKAADARSIKEKEQRNQEEYLNTKKEREEKDREEQKAREQKNACQNDCTNNARSCAADCYKYLNSINDCLLSCLRSKNSCISSCNR